MEADDVDGRVGLRRVRQQTAPARGRSHRTRYRCSSISRHVVTPAPVAGVTDTLSR